MKLGSLIRTFLSPTALSEAMQRRFRKHTLWTIRAIVLIVLASTIFFTPRIFWHTEAFKDYLSSEILFYFVQNDRVELEFGSVDAVGWLGVSIKDITATTNRGARFHVKSASLRPRMLLQNGAFEAGLLVELDRGTVQLQVRSKFIDFLMAFKNGSRAGVWQAKITDLPMEMATYLALGSKSPSKDSILQHFAGTISLTGKLDNSRGPLELATGDVKIQTSALTLSPVMIKYGQQSVSSIDFKPITAEGQFEHGGFYFKKPITIRSNIGSFDLSGIISFSTEKSSHRIHFFNAKNREPLFFRTLGSLEGIAEIKEGSGLFFFMATLLDCHTTANRYQIQGLLDDLACI